MDEEISSPENFEDEVRRIARHLWPGARFDGSAKKGGRERDGVFITQDCVHLVEATTSRTKKKATKDTKKLVKLARRMEKGHPHKAIKCWFVTLHEPTADQRGEADKHPEYVTALSLHQFRSRLVDAQEYISLRKRYPFGSARDPVTGGHEDTTPFIPNDLVKPDGSNVILDEIAESISSGDSVLLLGDYGAGKSTTCREVFTALASEFWEKRSDVFPIMLNLRDHSGQTNTAEALERHARNIGYHPPHHLVRAWRAGYCVLILDGFDELATPGWAGPVTKLRKIRYRSMELVRHFVNESPQATGLLLSGREHFFDSSIEREQALGIGQDTATVHVADFSDDQVAEFLEQRGIEGEIPSWLPSRPLLLSYLVARDLVDEVVRIGTEAPPAAGWDALLKLVCDREAEIEAGIDGATVRYIVERLARKARRNLDGLGPLQRHDIIESFKEICGYEPDEAALVLLQRLPGLGVSNPEDGSREFVDNDFADAARSGDVVWFIESPYDYDVGDVGEWQCGLDALGREVSAEKCRNNGASAGKFSAALREASDRPDGDVLAVDVFQTMVESNTGYDGEEKIHMRDICINSLDFDVSDVSYNGIIFTQCLFQRINLPPHVERDCLPKFEGCYIGLLDGRVSEKDLPADVFGDSCEIDEYSETIYTTAGILELGLSIGVRLTLVVLKKLYLQAGSGRKESALYRGLDHRHRRLIPDVLEVLQKHGLARQATGSNEPVWLPVRARSGRVRQLLTSPSEASDQVLYDASQIS